MSNEQNYERARAQVRALEQRVRTLEAHLGLAESESAVAATVPVKPRREVTQAPHGRGVPATVTVRRVSSPGVPVAAAPPAAPPQATSGLLSALGLDGLDAKGLVDGIGALVQDAVARALRPSAVAAESTESAAPAEPPAAAGQEHQPGELDWLATEPPAATTG